MTESQLKYGIPSLTPAEAFVYIKEHQYHRDAYCNSDYDTSCRCLEIFFKILDGHPFECDQPDLPPKKWEDMTEAEQQEHRYQELMLKMMVATFEADIKRGSIWDGLLHGEPSKSETIQVGTFPPH